MVHGDSSAFSVAFFIATPTRPASIVDPPCLYLCQAFVWSAEWVHAFTLLSAPLRICVSGGECGGNPAEEVKGGGLVGHQKKAKGRKRGIFTGIEGGGQL